MSNFDDQIRYLRDVSAALLAALIEIRALRRQVAAIRLPAGYGRTRRLRPL